METSEIIFELQWKRKQGIGYGDGDIASIGIWDTADTSLDWTTFKSYLCQNLGTAEDISFAYVDSEGDEIPIESECEFQEALKFARRRARRGQGIVLKLDKGALSNKTGRGAAEASLQGVAAKFTKLGVVRRHEKPKGLKPGNTRTAGKAEKLRWPVTTAGLTQAPKLSKNNVEDLKDDSPPPWFKKYMQKMKVDIISEVKNEVIYEFRQVLKYIETNKTCCCAGKNFCSTDVGGVQKKKKKKISDEESSDANLTVEQRELKLLKKIEKLQKREKKLEKKLDSKLEKLENKTKRMLEKKNHSKPRNERSLESKTTQQKRADLPVVLMDAILLNKGQKPDAHLKVGECFTKVWHIMNAGTIPWTDKTDLRLAWGTTGLEPEVTAVKCPPLEPGEHAKICVTFRAPDFPGTFESYWHFYHMGVRFGHWISCAVIVDPKEDNEDDCPTFVEGVVAANIAEDLCNKTKNEHAVDLSMNSKSDGFVHSGEAHSYEKINHPGIVDLSNEYESDTDSDNFSVTAHLVSSDSDNEDKFVVISMPAVSSSEDQSHTNNREAVPHTDASLEVQITDGCTHHEIPTNASAQMMGKTSQTTDLKSSMFESASDCSQSTEKSLSDRNSCSSSSSVHISSSNTKNVIYAADLAGNIVPVKVVHKPSQSAVNITSFKPSNIYAVDSRGCSIRLEKCKETSPNVDVKATHTVQTEITEDTSLNHGSRNEAVSAATSESSNETFSENNGNVIHILPETLMTGAVNVAASAFSTAKAVISNLRTIPSRDAAEAHLESLRENSQRTECSTPFCMGLLLEMGFANKQLNLSLLKKHNNDVSKVVAELLSSG